MPQNRKKQKNKPKNNPKCDNEKSPTIDAPVYSLENQKIDDPELVDLMQRIGTLNRSEQRRLMVKYRKFVENQNSNSNPNTAIQSIIKRYPDVEKIPTIKRYNKSQVQTNSQPVKISTRKNITSPTQGKATKPNKKSNSKDPVLYTGTIQINSSDSDYSSDQDLEGFVVPDNEIGSVEESAENEESKSVSLGDSDSDTVGTDEDLNDLFNDNSRERRGRKRKRDDSHNSDHYDIHSQIREIRNIYNSQKIDMKKVIEAKFNQEDTLWFYSRFERLKHLSGFDKFKLEDNIQEHFDNLKSLKEAGLYQHYNKPMKRNVIKEVLESDKPEDMKETIINRMKTIHHKNGEEYQKALTWFDTVMSIPTRCNNTIGSNLSDPNANHSDHGLIAFKLRQKLDQHLHGMNYVKRQIAQTVHTISNDPQSQGRVIALLGEPGVGKTTIASLIAKTIGMGFGKIPCTSISDRSVLIGHTSTYIGAIPGILTRTMINCGQLNNVILFDELDKMPDKSLTGVLVQLLDRDNNHQIKDAYCPEIDIDMSKNLYIIAINDLTNFDRALLDRLKIIKVDGYNSVEKSEICYHHIIPQIQNRTGITTRINYDTISYFVNKISPNISGVRDIMRYFEDIYEKLQYIRDLREFLKKEPEAWDETLQLVRKSNTVSERERERERVRPTKKTRNNRRRTRAFQNSKNLTNEKAIEFRDIIKVHFGREIPENIDLQDLNALDHLSIELIESLEDR